MSIKYKLSVSSYRKELREQEAEDVEGQVRAYANEKHMHQSGKSNKDIKYNKDVLARMIKRGCKPCEKRSQEEYIKSLEGPENPQVGADGG